METVLEKIPKNTPLWAVGLTTVLLSIAICAAGVYITVRPEVVKSMEVLATEKAAAQKLETSSQEFMMKLLTNLTEQVASLNGRVYTLEKELSIANIKLAESDTRNAQIEGKLAECENKLKSVKR